MSILINKDTRVLVQGITGHEGLFHTQQMMSYGTKIGAGVRPGKGGDWVLDGKVPIFDSAKAAVDATGANISIIFVPAHSAIDAIFEEADAGIPLIVCITEGIPIQDMMKVSAYLENRTSASLDQIVLACSRRVNVWWGSSLAVLHYQAILDLSPDLALSPMKCYLHLSKLVGF